MSAHLKVVHSIMLVHVRKKLYIHKFLENKKEVSILKQNLKNAKFWLAYIALTDCISRLELNYAGILRSVN